MSDGLTRLTSIEGSVICLFRCGTNFLQAFFNFENIQTLMMTAKRLQTKNLSSVSLLMEVPSMKLKLIMEKGPRKGEALEFNPGLSIRIGRLVRGNTIPVKDPGISSQHLLIEFDSGKWVITDLNSSNGTILNSSQLNPDTPFELRNGDEVKIGEYTSIRVQFVQIAASQLRRNPRRQAAPRAADGGGELSEATVEVSSVAVGRRDKDLERGNLDNGLDFDFGNGKLGVEMKNMGSVVEKGKGRGRGRARPKKGSALEDGNVKESREVMNNDGNVEITVIEKNIEPKQGRGRRPLKKGSALEDGNMRELIENMENDGNLMITENEKNIELKQGRGRPKKGSVLDNGNGNMQESREVGDNDGNLVITENEKDIEPKQGHRMNPKRTRNSKNSVGVISGLRSENPDAVVIKPARQVNLRRTRSMKSEEKVMSSSVSEKTPDNSALDNVVSYEGQGNEVVVENKKTRAKRGRKKNAQQHKDRVQLNVELVNGRIQEQMRVREGLVDVQQSENTVDKLNPGAEACEEFESPVKGDNRAIESNTGGGTFKDVVISVDSREKKFEAGDGPDLEKMTLGEWFDYLEASLLKQIHVVTDEIIADMQKRAHEFHEFMLQQHKEKGKEPVV
ncbi:hypothetical protein Ancab_013186 [Ancistrocladus abbreviatus]